MREVGAAAMPIIPSFQGLRANLEKGVSGPLERAGADGGRRFGDAAGRNLTASLSKHTKRAALLASGAFAIGAAGALKFGGDAVALAADLEQSVGAIDTVFGQSAEKMHAWAKAAATDVGLTQNKFNELGSLIGTQLKNGGTAMDRLAPKTNKLIKLGADLSSMFGGDTSEAVEALSSALKGERDPIEKYGVTLNEANIKAEALASGIAKAKVDSSELRQASIKLTVAQAKYNEEIRKHGKDSLEATKAEGTLLAATDRFNKVSAGKVDELTNQQKQAATLSLIYKQTADAQGNFGRESDTLSHKQQVLKASLENTKTEIGTALLPIVADAADFLLKEGVPAFQKFADWFGDKGAPAIATFIDDMKPIGAEVLPAVATGVESIAGFLKDAAPLAKDMVGAFNDMPDWAKQGLAVGGAGLVVKSKLGKGGLLGSGAGGSLTDPAYVYVVNGGGAGGGKGKGVLGSLPLVGGGTGSLVALFSLLAGGEQLDSTKSFFNKTETGSKSQLRKSLEKDLGKYADDLNIDLDKLTTDLDRFGSKGEYVQQVMKKLDDGSHPGFFKDWLDGVNPLSNKVADLGVALGHIEKSFGRLDKQIAERKRVAGILGGGDPSGRDISSTWGKIPDKKLKVLMDPATENTRKSVREMLDNVDGLTRSDFKVIFDVLGLTKAKDDAATLLKYMHDLTGMTPKSVPDGFQGPFKSNLPSSSNPKQVGPGLRIDTVNLNTADPKRAIADLQAIQRRAAIGGFG